MCINTHMYKTCVCVHVRICMCTYVHIYTCIYVYAHTCVCIKVKFLMHTTKLFSELVQITYITKAVYEATHPSLSMLRLDFCISANLKVKHNFSEPSWLPERLGGPRLARRHYIYLPSLWLTFHPIKMKILFTLSNSLGWYEK